MTGGERVFGGYRQPIPLESTQTLSFYVTFEKVLPIAWRAARPVRHHTINTPDSNARSAP
jgi:hypothetical protein